MFCVIHPSKAKPALLKAGAGFCFVCVRGVSLAIREHVCIWSKMIPAGKSFLKRGSAVHAGSVIFLCGISHIGCFVFLAPRGVEKAANQIRRLGYNRMQQVSETAGDRRDIV
jgi:hypothetical protein